MAATRVRKSDWSFSSGGHENPHVLQGKHTPYDAQRWPSIMLLMTRYHSRIQLSSFVLSDRSEGTVCTWEKITNLDATLQVSALPKPVITLPTFTFCRYFYASNEKSSNYKRVLPEKNTLEIWDRVAFERSWCEGKVIFFPNAPYPRS